MLFIVRVFLKFLKKEGGRFRWYALRMLSNTVQHNVFLLYPQKERKKEG